VSGRTASDVGSALVWKGIQLFGAKAISLIRFLVLARLLTPDDFGLLAIAAVAVDLVMAVTTVGVGEVLVQRAEIRNDLYHTAWTVGVLRAVLVAVVLIIGAPYFADLFGEPRATNILRMLALKPILDATSSIKVVDLTRKLRFQPIAMIKLSAAAIDTLGSLILVLVLPPLLVDVTVSIALVQSLGVWALVAGAFAGSLASVVLSFVIAPYLPRFRLERSAVRGLLRFGKWLFATSLVGIIGHAILRGIISARLGAAELGLFYLAVKLTALPNSVAGEVIRSVTFPVVSKVQFDLKRVRRAFQASFTAILAVLLPVYVIMIVLSISLCKYVLGPQWAGLAPVIQLLALDGVIDVPSDVAKPLLLGIGQPHKRFALKGIRTLMIVCLAWGLTSAWGVMGAAFAWVVAEGVQSAVAIAMVRQIIPRPFAGMMGVIVAIAVSAFVGGGVAWGVNALLPGILGLVAGALAALAIAISLLLVLDRQYQLDLASELGRAFPALATRLSMPTESR
jgi:O-antigen/teichoic acid export membrane protein